METEIRNQRTKVERDEDMKGRRWKKDKDRLVLGWCTPPLISFQKRGMEISSVREGRRQQNPLTRIRRERGMVAQVSLTHYDSFNYSSPSKREEEKILPPLDPLNNEKCGSLILRSERRKIRGKWTYPRRGVNGRRVAGVGIRNGGVSSGVH